MRSLFPKAGWMLAGVLALYVLSALAGVARGGSLDPPGVPGSTMRTLDQLIPARGQTLSSTGGCNSQRFRCVLSDQAVLDLETGLVWQRTPDPVAASWGTAVGSCEFVATGGRYGWGLSTQQEIATLIDTSPDHLPDGHPFIGIITASEDLYWTNTVTMSPTNTSLVARYFSLDTGLPSGIDTPDVLHRYWCVRGGDGYDQRR